MARFPYPASLLPCLQQETRRGVGRVWKVECRGTSGVPEDGVDRSRDGHQARRKVERGGVMLKLHCDVTPGVNGDGGGGYGTGTAHTSS
ncbi:hypothetical protein BaRGS_00031606 [Batillaria attramentaria]|uniref:Uncharacterized protein n=1 Tax=Batillaria attramentaria TaxID=370345 RepID=A0ABD0JR06_9CAEN